MMGFNHLNHHKPKIKQLNNRVHNYAIAIHNCKFISTKERIMCIYILTRMSKAPKCCLKEETKVRIEAGSETSKLNK